MRILIILCTLIPLLSFAQADSLDRKGLDLSYRIQLAGMQGTFSAGALLNFEDERIQLGLMYGYSPALANERPYHGVTIRSTWALKDMELAPKLELAPYIGISASLEVGGISFLGLPDGYPKNYYAPQSIHGIGAVGLKLKRAGDQGQWAFNMEAVTLDTHLWYLMIEKQINFKEAWSLSLGLEYRLFKQ